MVDSSTFLWLEELSEVGITLLELTNAICILKLLLHLSLTVALVDKPSPPTLGLLDIGQVAVAEEGEHTKETNQVSIAIVVHPVGLVPVWKHALVLVRDWGFITWLEVTGDPRCKENGVRLNICL